MSELSRDLADVLAANDGPDDLEATVLRYRRLTQRGGGGDGMEPRVAKLEAAVSHLERDVQEIRLDIREMRSDLRDVRDRIGKLEERVSHLPGKGYVVTVVILGVAVMSAVTTFQGNIQRLVGATPVVSVAPPVQ